MIQAIIFDMDGLLIDSEPQWRIAEIEVFAKVGVLLTETMTYQTTGLRTDEVINYWYQRQPWKNRTPAEVTADLNATALYHISRHAEVLPGVYEILDFVAKKSIPMAVASSSSMALIEAVLEKLKIRHLFSVIHSGTLEAKGKPDPAVYITTAKKLGIPATQCLALEDSVNGMRAGLKAGMKVVAIPAPESFTRPEYGEASLKIASLLDFTESVWEQINKLP
ncbi:hexitol phosphatase HxpB [Cytophagaceae bacterium YF14B1]|uniref:Hexitol phosphatase HxpB n=1 Tax=Xanthocytophaga flava TaxID=3048013 RepID=A0AAE3UBI6_9BACT|nr:hexitol phosphatase HxpB [Xanthocytophaga flavus]MDJ1483829.1 hexitol phosphatase HxpB [Xanthocytophaga flavus]